MEPKVKASPETAAGPLLRQAREARGLSIDEVAQDLRLSPRVIQALEAEAYDRLPGPTYVRGYLRSYAQFLELDPQQLIDVFNTRPEAARRTDMTAPAPVRQITSSDAMVRLGTVAIAVIVFGLAAMWWSGHDGSAPETDPLTSVEPTADRPAAQPEPPAAATAVRPEAPAVAPQPVPGTPEKPVAPPASASAGTLENPRAEESAATAPVPPLDPNMPLSRLVLYVHEDSWADVRDAQQRRLLYETIPAGRVVTVEGVAPISVFLGNVEGVTVEFNGQQYDALRHKRGEVARFTLGSPRG